MALLPGPAALVHEWFTPRSVGGAELVVQQLDALLERPQLAALVDGESSRSASWLADRSILTSFVQRLPWGVSHVQQYLPLLPLAIEQLDLSGYPLVLSSSHLVAKGVLTSPDQCHLSYVHTPVRYAWDQMHAYLRQSALARRGLSPLIRWQLHRLRQWDVLSAQRPDALIANSRFTAARIRRYWGRSATVVHPPVAVERFRWDQPRDDVYLCLCRLVPYKRVDLVVQAFNATGLPLVVIGDGPERQRLAAMAGPNVQLLGRLPQQEVNSWLARCRAYVYAGLEDFGIAPVEAMASGAPVIGLGQGGLLDSVRCISTGCAQPTGLLFADQTPAALVAALERFEQQRLWTQLPAESLRQWAERFSPQRFRQRMGAVIDQAWNRHQRLQAERGCALSVPLG
ncbi:glycosyltransferase [Synechococcus sp. LA31]|jgi:glycosyltransferase involved in cell wall biosynthesis|uniref:glycosyltransferase n=1 Tax=Synechococcus sp. LA31 TaxID=2741953 RepID=UPI001BDC6A11|nr:glycosyltransferase [Synechococcus sp. LA31]QVV66487.1 glycosyltransferase [Synechococcus sp. LA31]